MQAILALTERLGKAIAESPQAQKLIEARNALDNDPDLQDLLANYHQQAQKIQQAEQSNQPVEVDDKHKLSELQTKLAASDEFKAFSAAQVNYIDLMRKVNAKLSECLAEIEK